MDDTETSTLANLAGFIAATAGRIGTVGDLPGGVAVASAVPVANGYVNAVFRTDPDASTTALLEGARVFFDRIGHPYVVWIEPGDDELFAACLAAGATEDPEDTPGMAISRPIPVPPGLEVRQATTAADRSTFGVLCETGYAMPGMAWMIDHHQMFDAPGSLWVIASDRGADLGVGTGFLDGRTGGIYYVGTPPEHRGRGAAATIAAWLTNRLLDDGADIVTLEASPMGLPIYERLGFTTFAHLRRCIFAREG